MVGAPRVRLLRCCSSGGRAQFPGSPCRPSCPGSLPSVIRLGSRVTRLLQQPPCCRHPLQAGRFFGRVWIWFSYVSPSYGKQLQYEGYFMMPLEHFKGFVFNIEERAGEARDMAIEVCFSARRCCVAQRPERSRDVAIEKVLLIVQLG